MNDDITEKFKSRHNKSKKQSTFRTSTQQKQQQDILYLRLIYAPKSLKKYTLIDDEIEISKNSIINKRSKEYAQYENEIIIGRWSRAKKNHITIENTMETVTVSRHQVSIIYTPGGFYATCLATQNPTTIYTCGHPIILKKDFIVTMGESLIKFRITQIHGYEQYNIYTIFQQQQEQQYLDLQLDDNTATKQQQQIDIHTDIHISPYTYTHTYITLEFLNEIILDSQNNPIDVKFLDGTSIKGNTKQLECPLNEQKEFNIGSSPTADLSIQDDTVQPIHAKITHVPQIGWILNDSTSNENFPLTGVLMKTYDKYYKKQNSFDVLLRKGMKFGTFGTVFEVL